MEALVVDDQHADWLVGADGVRGFGGSFGGWHERVGSVPGRPPYSTVPAALGEASQAAGTAWVQVWRATLPIFPGDFARRAAPAVPPPPTDGGRAMTEAQQLLTRIAALRQRLEQAQGLVQAADTAAAALREGSAALDALEVKVAAGTRQQALLDNTLRPLPILAGDGATLPAQLTTRAARLLRRAHDLIGKLRAVADDALLSHGGGDPLAQLYRETVSMTDTVLRTVQAFPESPTAQVRLCEGLEAVLNVVDERLATVLATLAQRHHAATRCITLAELLDALASGHQVEMQHFLSIAEAVQADALDGLPLHFPAAVTGNLAQDIAAHGLAVAAVIARLSRHELEWRGRPLEPILAALVHDAGMLKVPRGVVYQAGPLKDEHRRMVDAHPILSADMAIRITPSATWLVETSGQHHERLDGTGYPTGLRDLQLKSLVRLLAVCDVYAAMCQPRPYRAALDTRTALTDTLLLAEKGLLDKQAAEKLLLLSFYPVGTMVELSDGSVGVVVATHQGRRDLNTPARPVVALLNDSQGQPVPLARHLDLSEAEGRSILRGISAAERRERAGRRYPDLAA
jgi:HD-GYP domain-containing protein (c-di-GMP phosphodiesterase class II)